jgi:hypothetical protein
MKMHNMILATMIGPAAALAAEPAKETRFFEMRTYYAMPAKGCTWARGSRSSTWSATSSRGRGRSS